MMLFSVLLLAGLAVPPEPGGRLILEASSPQQTVLLGEPLKIVVRWRAEKAPVKVIQDEEFSHGHIGFRIEDSGGARNYGEEARGHSEIEVHMWVRPEQERVSELVLLYGSENGREWQRVVPCKSVGPCSIRVVYHNTHDAVHVESNPVRFDVRAPSGADKEVFAAIEKKPSLLACSMKSEGKALVARFPESPYLRWAALRCLDQDLDVLYNSFQDPDTREAIGKLPRAEWKDRARAANRRILDKILALGHLGPFEPERLDLALNCALRADQELAHNLRVELLTRYPDSQAAIRIREEEKKDEAAEDDKE